MRTLHWQSALRLFDSDDGSWQQRVRVAQSTIWADKLRTHAVYIVLKMVVIFIFKTWCHSCSRLKIVLWLWRDKSQSNLASKAHSQTTLHPNCCALSSCWMIALKVRLISQAKEETFLLCRNYGMLQCMQLVHSCRGYQSLRIWSIKTAVKTLLSSETSKIAQLLLEPNSCDRLSNLPSIVKNSISCYSCLFLSLQWQDIAVETRQDPN